MTFSNAGSSGSWQMTLSADGKELRSQWGTAVRAGQQAARSTSQVSNPATQDSTDGGPGTAKGCWQPYWNSDGGHTDQGEWVACAKQRSKKVASPKETKKLNKEISLAVHWKDLVRSLRASDEPDHKIREILKSKGLSSSQIEAAMAPD